MLSRSIQWKRQYSVYISAAAELLVVEIVLDEVPRVDDTVTSSAFDDKSLSCTSKVAEPMPAIVDRRLGAVVAVIATAAAASSSSRVVAVIATASPSTIAADSDLDMLVELEAVEATSCL